MATLPLTPTEGQVADGGDGYIYTAYYRPPGGTRYLWVKTGRSSNTTTQLAVAVANAVTVGNVSVTPNAVTIGNVTLTPNTATVGNVVVSTTNVKVGNTVLSNNGLSVANVTITPNAVTVGNVVLNQSNVKIGNTTISDNAITVANVSQANAESNLLTALVSGSLTLTNTAANTVTILNSSGIFIANTESGQTFSITSNVLGSGGNVISVNNLQGEVVLKTANIPEHPSNLYFTNTRVIYALTAGQNIVLESNGLISASGNVLSVNGQTGNIVLSTANVAEDGNLYFTNTRAVSAFTSGNGVDIASNGLITVTVSGTGAGAANTDQLPEGNSNLYFTNTRVVYALTAGNGVNITANGMITVFGAGIGGNVTSVNELTGDVVLKTANIQESASNLYFTNARVIANVLAYLNTGLSGIRINGNGGANGQILIANGDNTLTYRNRFSASELPPTVDETYFPHYGEMWYDTVLERMYIWIYDASYIDEFGVPTDGYWFDCLPPNF